MFGNGKAALFFKKLQIEYSEIQSFLRNLFNNNPR